LLGISDYDNSKETIILNPLEAEPNPYF